MDVLEELSVPQQPPAFLHMVASYLPWEAAATKRDLLRRIQQAHPGESWAHGRFAIAMSHDSLAWHLSTLTEPKYGNPEWAVELASEAVRLVPNDGDFRNTRGLAYERVGNWGEAALSLEKAVELSQGGDPGDWFFLAMPRRQPGHREDARK